MKSVFAILISVFFCLSSFCQTKKPVCNPCILKDSVERNLTFIQYNIRRIFSDSFDCRELLLRKMAEDFILTKDKKYLDALSLIRQYPAIHVEGMYTDIIKLLIEKDFSEFLNQLYLAKGKYLSLEKELISTMNMIVDGKPYKQRWLDMLNAEIQTVKDRKDKAKEYYLQKLKIAIQKEKY